MKRPLKFRVWDIKQQRYLLPHDTGAYYYLYPTIAESLEHESGRGVGIVHLGHAIAYTDKYVVQRFTGLADCYGKDIYEGDILEVVSFWLDDEYMTLHTSAVVWNAPRCSFEERFVSWRNPMQKGLPICGSIDVTRSHVIGNIHENPELLPITL